MITGLIMLFTKQHAGARMGGRNPSPLASRALIAKGGGAATASSHRELREHRARSNMSAASLRPRVALRPLPARRRRGSAPSRATRHAVSAGSTPGSTSLTRRLRRLARGRAARRVGRQRVAVRTSAAARSRAAVANPPPRPGPDAVLHPVAPGPGFLALRRSKRSRQSVWDAGGLTGGGAALPSPAVKVSGPEA